jgi:hypothetical protein
MRKVPDDVACADSVLICQLISMYDNIVMLPCADTFSARQGR